MKAARRVSSTKKKRKSSRETTKSPIKFDKTSYDVKEMYSMVQSEALRMTRKRRIEELTLMEMLNAFD